MIIVSAKSLFNSTKVHWGLNNIVILRYAELFRVNGFMEDPGLTTFPNRIQHTLCCLIPGLVDWSILRESR
jgi:hypothetical protein